MSCMLCGNTCLMVTGDLAMLLYVVCFVARSVDLVSGYSRCKIGIVEQVPCKE